MREGLSEPQLRIIMARASAILSALTAHVDISSLNSLGFVHRGNYGRKPFPELTTWYQVREA